MITYINPKTIPTSMVDDFWERWRTIDSGIIKRYSYLTKRWEDSGINKYGLAQIGNILSWISVTIPYRFGILATTLTANDCLTNILGKTKPHLVEDTENHPAKDKLVWANERLRELSRIPLHVVGFGYMIKSGMSFYNCFINNEPLLEDALTEIETAIGLLGLGFSMAVKDTETADNSNEDFHKKSIEDYLFEI